MRRPATPSPPPTRGADPKWERRCAGLHGDLRRPAAAMVRRAFGSAFRDEEIEDLYAAAWLATLRALDRRRDELDDEALRRYVLTAVANHASKELRRRGRRPTVPLEQARSVADGSPAPDERAALREDSRIARDVLGTLPPRRRAVILLRYGWGLEPREVLRLVPGLSPRAYRKEITRGVEEMGAKLAQVAGGEWCRTREHALRALASGDGGAEERAEARRHLAHCRPCAEYVSRLNGRLHGLGGGAAWIGVADVIGDERATVADRTAGLVERARESVAMLLGRGEPADAATGLGAAGMAKLAAAGGLSKLAAACLGTGAAATACVAAGLGPASVLDDAERRAADRGDRPRDRAPHRVAAAFDRSVGERHDPPPPDAGAADRQAASPPPAVEDPPPEPVPVVDREFGLGGGAVEGAGAAETGSRGPDGSGGGGGSGRRGAPGAREFGP